jgi:sulfur-oxidizing protein SoxY
MPPVLPDSADPLPARRRAALALLAALAAPAAFAAAPPPPPPSTPPRPALRDDDPFGSGVWPDMRREFLGRGRVVFDERVKVEVPAFAVDPMMVPVTVSAHGLRGIRRIVVLVDRNPIRKVVDFEPMQAEPALGLRFKLEQASPVRAAVLLADGRWHVGGALVDSAGGGCTVPGATRQDGSWARTLGLVDARLFPATAAVTAAPAPAAPDGRSAAEASLDPHARAESGGRRLKLRVMHPMDTGLVGGIPAFHVTRLAVRDGAGRELLRLATFEPVSENPVFTFDFARAPQGPLRIEGRDNNGNRIDASLPD